MMRRTSMPCNDSLLMEKLLHFLGHTIKPNNQWDQLPINECAGFLPSFNKQPATNNMSMSFGPQTGQIIYILHILPLLATPMNRGINVFKRKHKVGLPG